MPRPHLRVCIHYVRALSDTYTTASRHHTRFSRNSQQEEEPPREMEIKRTVSIKKPGPIDVNPNQMGRSLSSKTGGGSLHYRSPKRGPIATVPAPLSPTQIPQRVNLEGGHGKLTFTSKPQNNTARKFLNPDYSHNTFQKRQIEEDNEKIGKRLLEIVTTGPLAVETAPMPQSSAAINRRKQEQKIAQENLRFYKKLQAVKPTPNISRDTHAKHHQAQTAYGENARKFRPQPTYATPTSPSATSPRRSPATSPKRTGPPHRIVSEDTEPVEPHPAAEEQQHEEPATQQEEVAADA